MGRPDPPAGGRGAGLELFSAVFDKLEFGVTATNLLGWRDGGHREHCMGTPVGPRVMGSATYRF